MNRDGAERKIMKQKPYALISILAALAILLSACAAPTADAAAISTSAAQTVEARFTQQAPAASQTPAPATETATPQATSTLGFPPTATTAPGLPTPTPNGIACYRMVYVSDVTIPDGMIVAPGSTFTKTWRVRNDGNCPWDQKYSLVLSQGDALSTVTKIPLTKVIYPGDTADLSIELTAPTTAGIYTGYWRLATPYGGSIGVGDYNQALIVKITASANPGNAFAIDSVVYSQTRQPIKGCANGSADYLFTATVAANGPGEIRYRWDKNPDNGQPQRGVLKFSEAGSKVITWNWHLSTDSVQGIDRWVSLTTIIESKETSWARVTFHFSCTP
jgi:hypothetical protein